MNNSTFFIAVTIVILHFVIGIGWLVYKIMTAEKVETTSLDDMKKTSEEGIQ